MSRSKRERGGHFVRLYVDKEGGIGLDELQSVSEEVSAILDAEDPIDSTYTLEVSSPGLDRPAQEARRITAAFVGRLVKLSSYEPWEGRRHWTGRLQSVEEGAITVTLEKEKGTTARIPSKRSRTAAWKWSSSRPMANQLRQQIEQITREKNINPDVIIAAIEDAILTASKKYYKNNEDLRSRFNNETGQIEVFAVQQIVETVEIPRPRSAWRRRRSSSPRPRSARRSSSRSPRTSSAASRPRPRSRSSSRRSARRSATTSSPSTPGRVGEVDQRHHQAPGDGRLRGRPRARRGRCCRARSRAGPRPTRRATACASPSSRS